MLSTSNGMKKLFYIFALAVVLLPSLAFAYTAPSIWPTGFWGPLISCTGDYAGVGPSSGVSPCTSLCDLINTIENVIYFGLSIAVFIITPILIAWGGAMYMFSRGKPEGISSAKKILTGALIGLLIALCAWLIVNTVITAFLGSNTYIGGFSSASCTVQPNPTQ